MPNQYTNKTPRRAIIPIGPSIAYIPLTQDKFALIDVADAALLEKKWWFAMKVRGGMIYASTTGCKRMQTFLTGHSPTDHINRNPLDNRRANLREVDRCKNNQNRALFKSNTSGCAGVYKKRNKWQSSITANGVRYDLGRFACKEDAIKARKAKELVLHGQYSPML